MLLAGCFVRFGRRVENFKELLVSGGREGRTTSCCIPEDAVPFKELFKSSIIYFVTKLSPNFLYFNEHKTEQHFYFYGSLFLKTYF